MTVTIEPPNSVVLIVGREQFTVPPSFNGATSVGTKDCVAFGVRSVEAASPPGMTLLGEYELESEGLLSVRDVYTRELLSVGVDPGICRIAIWGNDASEPDVMSIVVQSVQRLTAKRPDLSPSAR